MSADSDRLLIAQLRAEGEAARAAWDEFVNRYEGRLRAYVRRRLTDQALCDDVVQEIFLGFVNSLKNYDDHRDLQTWLFTIASHKVTDQLRRRSRRRDLPSGEADEQFNNKPDHRQTSASSIARGKERQELEAAAVARALRELIAGFRSKGEFKRIMVLELLFVKGWPNWQIAQFLQLSEQQIANYRFAAIKKLTEAMQAAGLPPEVFPELRDSGT